MDITIHEHPADYEKEYARVRATLIQQGTSLNQWLLVNGINRQMAYRALRGKSFGRKSLEIRYRILRSVLGEAA